MNFQDDIVSDPIDNFRDQFVLVLIWLQCKTLTEIAITRS